MAEQARDPDCIFCRIVAGEVPAAVIFEDEMVLAFMDAFPSSPGHALVIPRAHHASVLELPPDLLTACSLAAQRLAKAAMQVFEPDGITVLQFNGAAAGQTVFHYHQHIIPRWQNQDWQAHGKQQGDPEQLARQAAALRTTL